MPTLQRLKLKHVAKGEVLIKAGDTDRVAYFIVDGAFQVVWDIEGKASKVDYCRPGEWVGEIALIRKKPRTASVIAIEPSVVISLDETILNSLSIPSQLEIYRNLSELAATRIDRMNEELTETYRQIDSDVREAARYLQSLLPPRITDGKIKTDWRFLPCRKLGGDAFEYFWLDEDRFAIYVLDVCGHGVKAALYSSTIFNTIRTGRSRNFELASPGHVLRELNELFAMDYYDSMYFTIWYGVYDQEKRQLHYASAGHPPALLWNDAAEAEERLQQLSTPSACIGLSQDLSYEASSVNVAPSSQLILYTDGVYELIRDDGTLWTREEFLELIRHQLGTSVFSLDWFLTYAKDLQGKRNFMDDFTLLQVVLD
jgi:sigma-B regulation protein RsbU (phosphoserine phosphatase)